LDCDSDYFINHYILIMYKLMQCLGTDKQLLSNWIMVARFRDAKDVLDKRNRLINQGIPKDELAIIRYRLKGNT